MVELLNKLMKVMNGKFILLLMVMEVFTSNLSEQDGKITILLDRHMDIQLTETTFC